jgi:oligopeptide/dipeptide ABC transporter ATP-binding protein
MLEVEGLSVEFAWPQGWVRVVDDVSFSIGPGETVGLVGESGSGKSVSALSILGLTRVQGGRIARGSIRFLGRELTSMPEAGLRRIRGNEIGIIFQQPIRSLNPAFTVGEQIAEAVRQHRAVSRDEAWTRAVEMLERVRIPRAAQRAREYPHMFSGGMCQRVMIAMALACDPKLLIADEPTTALDVTIQAKILELMSELQRELGISILFISHDLAVIAQMCDRVAVMYAGQVVETAWAEDLFAAPRHPYTAGLLGAIPKADGARRLATIPGLIPNMGTRFEGCRFAPRCAHRQPGRCDATLPPMTTGEDERTVRCLRAGEISLQPAVAAR